MKLYLWKNSRANSDFTDDDQADFGNHSGGYVILAETKEKAKELASEKSEPIEIDLTKEGIVIYCDGEC